MLNCRYELMAYPRRLPGSTPVVRVVHRQGIEGKSYWKPYCLRFVVILEGEATQRESNRQWRVPAPGLLVQRPGGEFLYGSDGEWADLTLAYPPKLWSQWLACGLVQAHAPALRIADENVLRAYVPELLHRLERCDEPWQVDAVDRLCELLVLSGAAAVPPTRVETHSDPIFTIHAYFRQHFAEALDMEEVALDHGLSPSSFRRRWKRRFGGSPLRFVQQLRMTEACRLLMDTDRPIAEIARAVGYEDPFHFSRTFHRIVGVSPSEHRRLH